MSTQNNACDLAIIRRAIKYGYCAHSTHPNCSLSLWSNRPIATVTQNNANSLQQLLPPNIDKMLSYRRETALQGAL